jgi:hypothetical protein
LSASLEFNFQEESSLTLI